MFLGTHRLADAVEVGSIGHLVSDAALPAVPQDWLLGIGKQSWAPIVVASAGSGVASSFWGWRLEV
jgi:hypothetical protein